MPTEPLIRWRRAETGPCGLLANTDPPQVQSPEIGPVWKGRPLDRAQARPIGGTRSRWPAAFYSCIFI